MTQCDEAIRRQLHKPTVYALVGYKPTVYVLVGYPGSGKTYFAKKVLMNHPWHSRVYISSDDIRAELCGDAGDQSQNYKVFEIFYERAREALKDGCDVILDATHLTKKTRRKCCNRFADLYCRFVAVQIDTPAEEAMRRNKNRERVVPDDAMHRMISMYEPVSKDAGFNDIWRV